MRQLLLWEGVLSRRRILQLFAIQQGRASQWLQEFRKNHPRWTRWDRVKKAHVATSAAREDADTGSSAERARSLDGYLFLTQTPLTVRDDAPGSVVWSAFSDLAVPRSAVFSAFRRAISEALVVQTSYRSLRNPDPHDRTLSPHNLVRVGRRWHVRAYCHETEDFRDFALGRFVNVRLTTHQRLKAAENDSGWNRRVEVALMAHPGLSYAQQIVVRGEYFNGTAELVESCRACLVPYFLAEMKATISPDRDPAPTWLIAVANVEEVRPWIFE